MRIISLSLRNIRSYKEAELSFEDGITLLSGDIGAGKSTILLAVEFSLFGLARGELTGAALLRHGESEGSATLRFSVGDKNYEIQRNLKRTKSSIQQDICRFNSGSSQETLTASELRARVFEILGYPLQFLNKQKNLLYRFTIYTPQEEMKTILTQPVEDRIETIRRIFGIDAYRTIRENSQALARAFKDRGKTTSALLDRSQQDDERLSEQLERTAEVAAEHESLLPEKTRLAALMKENESTILKMEKEWHEAQQAVQQHEMRARNRTLLLEEIRRLQEIKAQMEVRLKASESGVRSVKEKKEELKGSESADRIEDEIASYREGIRQLSLEEGKILAIMEQCAHGPEVKAGTVCPTCQQLISGEHLGEVQSGLKMKHAAAEKRHSKIAARISEANEALDSRTKALERARQFADLDVRLKQQETTAAELKAELSRLEDAITTQKEELQKLPPQEDRSALDMEYRKQADSLKEHKHKSRADQEKMLQLEKNLSRLEQQQKDLEKVGRRLSEIRKEKKALQEKIRRDSEARSWLLDRFTPFTSKVEQHVLGTIHTAIASSYQDWFARLVEDDGLQTVIDSEFSPVMRQQGYDTSVDFLSGGERTAVSLAYRLSLVHAIHVLQPHLGTAGIVMLDEPTDGFSAGQLDRVRDVLHKLRMDQVILVSHEQQLEGFVDHIIKVEKTPSGSVIGAVA